MTLPSTPSATVCIPLPCAGGLKGRPAEVARAWTSAPGSFWLDSAGTARGETAWSFLGVQASHALTYRNGEAQRETAAGREPLGRASFLEFLQRELTAQARPRAVPGRPGAPPFRGGWFALLAYDLGIASLCGTAFGKAGEGYMRFSYASPLDKIKELIEVLKKEYGER
jgi:anthranilate/para-aminobenzoate synthase component I